MLDSRAPFDFDVIKDHFPINHDLSPESQQARKSLYCQKRDLILKTAETRAGSREIAETVMAVIDVKEEFVLYSWNLTHDYDLERFPDEIARCLQTALLAERSNSQILPHYTDFYKNGMIVSIEVSTLPVQLRHVIGNRQEMQEYGATLMKSLI